MRTNITCQIHPFAIYVVFSPLCLKSDQTSLFFLTDLSRNKLTELPQECTDYYSLERLVLYHNSIRSIPDSVIYLQSLQFLDLSRNQLRYAYQKDHTGSKTKKKNLPLSGKKNLQKITDLENI